MKRGIILFLLGIIFLIPVLVSGDLSGSIGFSVSVQGGMICNLSSLQWEDYRDNPFDPPKRNAIGDDSNCYHGDGINHLTGAPDTTCCGSRAICERTEINDLWPLGWNSPDSKIFSCQLTTKTLCQHYSEDETSCTEGGNGNPDAARNSLQERGVTLGRSNTWQKQKNGFDYTCWNLTTGRCVWNSSFQGASKCGGKENVTEHCLCNSGQGDCQNSSDEIGTCTWMLNRTEGDCTGGTGYETHYYIGIPTGQQIDPTCNGQEVMQTIDCSDIIMMDFFDKNNFIMCVLLLLSVYSFQLILNKKRK